MGYSLSAADFCLFHLPLYPRPLLILSFPLSNIDSIMEDPLAANTVTRISTRSFEKNWFDHSASQTPVLPATPTANVIRFVSGKLLTWGVEARGACVVSCRVVSCLFCFVLSFAPAPGT